jgi:hypothetical protein
VDTLDRLPTVLFGRKNIEARWRQLTTAATDQTLVSWLFLRLLALIYLVAFASLSTQIAGLAGPEGILPAGEYLAEARLELGAAAYWRIPTVFWFCASDIALQLACLAGMAAAVLVFFDIRVRGGLFACYGLYLSLLYAGQDFLSFQWDSLLLETGFLALLLSDRTRLVLWLYRFLLFRFMFMGGVVKLASHDPSWRDLTALQFHLETQPLPSPLAWYVHQWPAGWLQAITLLTLVIELAIPLFIFLSRRYRLAAGAAFLALQGGIMLTGNFAFFNVLTVALCLFVLEDRDIEPILGHARTKRILEKASPPGTMARSLATGMGIVVLVSILGLLWLTNFQRLPPQPVATLLHAVTTLNVVNGYGPFAVINTERREIVVEGSNDGKTWMPYEFGYKPGDPGKPLSWNIPHQPRLDWQMWFAALGEPERNAWFPRFLKRLREGSPAVLRLLKHNPFAGHPPALVRAQLYGYRFATPREREATGQIWHRELMGEFDPLAPIQQR